MNAPTPAEDRLRELLHERARLAEPHLQTTQALRRLTVRFPAERRRSVFTLTVVAAAAVVVVVALSLGAVSLTSHHGSRFAPVGPPLPKPAATVAGVPLVPGSLLATSNRTFTTPSPDLVVDQVLWVDDIHEATVTRLDANTLRSLGTVRYLDRQPSAQGALIRAGSVVLLPLDNTAYRGRAQILRFDATTGRRLAPIDVAHAGGIAATPLGVFAVVGNDTVGLVDAQRGRVTRTFAMPVDHALTYTDGLLWGWDRRTSTLVGVDPARGVGTRRYVLPGFADVPLTADGAGGLLLAAAGGTVRVEASTGRVAARTPAVATNWVPDGNGLLWGAVGGQRLVALDRKTLVMKESYTVANLDLLSVSAGKSLLYAGDHATGRIHVLDLRHLRSLNRRP